DIPNYLKEDWIFRKSKNMIEYQTEVLKIKHPSIFTDQNFNDVLSKTAFLLPNSDLSLNDFLYFIRSF
ncbi:7356_t:CDS:1, partial [Racocetra persica]